MRSSIRIRRPSSWHRPVNQSATASSRDAVISLLTFSLNMGSDRLITIRSSWRTTTGISSRAGRANVPGLTTRASTRTSPPTRWRTSSTTPSRKWSSRQLPNCHSSLKQCRASTTCPSSSWSAVRRQGPMSVFGTMPQRLPTSQQRRSTTKCSARRCSTRREPQGSRRGSSGRSLSRPRRRTCRSSTSLPTSGSTATA